MPILTKRLDLALLLAVVAAGCGEDDGGLLVDAAADGGGVDAALESAADAGADAGKEAGAADSAPPLYAIMTQVYRLDDRSVFVTLTNTLDITTLDLPNAREFGGVANLNAVGGRLLVSDGEEPKITSFNITADRKWEAGPVVSFATYPLSDNANWYYQFVLDDHTVYLPFDGVKRIVWNPSAMEIKGVMDDGTLPLTDGALLLEAGGNRNGVRYQGAVLQAFFYHDKDWFDHGTRSHVVAYDPTTHKQTKVIDVPCPGLSIATRDELGQTYFSSWGYLPTRALFKLGPAPCVVRVKADVTLDEAFTTDLTTLTGGRLSSNFRYIGGGKAIANVLHHELLNVDFNSPYSAAADEAISATGPHWKLWLFDMTKNEAKPIEGIDVHPGSGAQFTVLDGRTFVFLPYEEWARTKVYELDPGTGKATVRFDTPGDIFKWIKVR